VKEAKMVGTYRYMTREVEQWMKVMGPLCPVMTIMGPRQAGKTQLIKEYFPNLPYYDFEDDDTRALVKKNVIGFVRENINGAIFDEFQFVPEVTKALKVVSDELIREAHKRGESSVPVRFVITGSHNYLHNDNITETMVGRTSVIEMLSMTAGELNLNDPFELMFKGGYPILYVNGETPETFFPRYVNTYLEREIRLLHEIEDLTQFRFFMGLCAQNVGQIINYETMTSQIGIKMTTLRKWLSLLEATYITFMALPYHENYGKVISHRPKLYFYDTGLAAYLIGLKFKEEIPEDPDLKGKLFENLVMSEIKKKLLSKNRMIENMYFWNVTGEGGYEVDLLLGRKNKLKAIEIKSGDTFDPWWMVNAGKLEQLVEAKKYVIYSGPTQEVEGGMAVNFKDVAILL
jgi:predicted AAA+ superfamily ATPase